MNVKGKENNVFADWYVCITFSATTELPDNVGVDIAERLADYHAVPAVGSLGGTLNITIEAENAFAATNIVPRVMDAISNLTHTVDITGVEVRSEEEMDKYLDSMEFPELVGLTEIAEMAGVSRQRANTLVKQQTFPVPIVTVAAGQFRLKAAVENWLSTWERKPGRRTGGRTLAHA